MNRRSVVSCLTAMLALTACDPLFSTQYRQPIAPLSPDQCVEAALRGSPHIAIVSREKNHAFPAFRLQNRPAVLDQTVQGRNCAVALQIRDHDISNTPVNPKAETPLEALFADVPHAIQYCRIGNLDPV